MTDKKLEKIWTSAPDIDMLPEQIRMLARRSGFYSDDAYVEHVRQVANQALRDKMFSHMKNNNQMYFMSGFMITHDESRASEIFRLYEYPQDMIGDLMRSGGIIDIYEGVRGKNIITIANKRVRWSYEVYKVREGKNEQVKTWLYNVPDDIDRESHVVRRLMVTTDYKRNAYLSKVLNTENTYGETEEEFHERG